MDQFHKALIELNMDSPEELQSYIQKLSSAVEQAKQKILQAEVNLEVDVVDSKPEVLRALEGGPMWSFRVHSRSWGREECFERADIKGAVTRLGEESSVVGDVHGHGGRDSDSTDLVPTEVLTWGISPCGPLAPQEGEVCV